jgi:hypothetical protein
MMPPLEQLSKLNNFLTEDTWTQNAMGRRVDDKPTQHFDPQAVRFCLWGACIKLRLDSLVVAKALVDAGVAYADSVGTNGLATPTAGTLVMFNDYHTFTEIKRGLNKAMLYLKAQKS